MPSSSRHLAFIPKSKLFSVREAEDVLTQSRTFELLNSNPSTSAALMTQSKRPMTSSPETIASQEEQRKAKKKRSYFSKLWGGRKKSKDRKEEKRQLALSSRESDSTDQNSTPIKKKNKDKYYKSKPKKAKSCVELESQGKKLEQRSDAVVGDKKHHKRKLRFWGKKKKELDPTVHVELSIPTGETPPDLISSDGRQSSISCPTKRDSDKTNATNDSNNNSDRIKRRNWERIENTLQDLKRDEPGGMTSTPQRTDLAEVHSVKSATQSHPRQLIKEFSMTGGQIPRKIVPEYESATVGRKPRSSRNDRFMEKVSAMSRIRGIDGNERPPEDLVTQFKRSRSFSEKTVKNVSDRSSDENDRNRSAADKYASQCRETSYLIDARSVQKKCPTSSTMKSNFLRWHSVGDIQRQISRENKSDLQSFTVDVTPQMLKSPVTSREVVSRTSKLKSISLQNLTSKELSLEPRWGTTVNRMTGAGTSNPQRQTCSKESNSSVASGVKDQLSPKSIRDSRHLLNKTLSKSEVNLSSTSTIKHQNKEVLMKPCVEHRRRRVSESTSPNRHSVDIFQLKSRVSTSPMRKYDGNHKPTLYTNSKVIPGHDDNQSNSNRTGVTTWSSSNTEPLYSNVSSPSTPSQPNPMRHLKPKCMSEDILYNFTGPNVCYTATPALNSGWTATTSKLSYVSQGGTSARLRNSKSAGALCAPFNSDDTFNSDVPTPKRSIYEQQNPVPDFSEDVEVLLAKLRNSLREKTPNYRSKSTYDLTDSSESNPNRNIYSREPHAHRSINNHCSERLDYPAFSHRDVNENQLRHQMEPTHSSPHRALPSTSYGEVRGAGVSRSRSRARSIAKRFNMSGSTDNLTSQSSFSVCTSNNWSTELDGNRNTDVDGYCRMKSLVSPERSQAQPIEAHVVRRRYCPDGDSVNDYVYLSGAINRGDVTSSTALRHSLDQRRHTAFGTDSMISFQSPKSQHNHAFSQNCAASNTFYYGRRPVSGSYVEQTSYVTPCAQPNPTLYQNSDVSPRRYDNGGKTDSPKRTKIFYALDV